jgi:phage N-6-adenine-methyltransferase
MNVHFSSETNFWETPQALFDALNAEFAFTLDVCALAENAKCPKFFTPEQNGLFQKWTGRCWMNPPYGRAIGEWMRKAYESALQGVLVVCLVPSRTDTAWWHDYAMKGEIQFLKGRLKFGDAKYNAPFPSAVVIFRPSKVADVNKSAARDNGWLLRQKPAPQQLSFFNM